MELCSAADEKKAVCNIVSRQNGVLTWSWEKLLLVGASILIDTLAFNLVLFELSSKACEILSCCSFSV